MPREPARWRAASARFHPRAFQTRSSAKVVLDLNDAVGEVVRLLQAEITKKHIQMELELTEGLSAVTADRIQLQQLLFNLLQNGIEAIDQAGDQVGRSPGHLSVRTRRDGSSAIVVEIADSGIGLANPSQIFDAFFTTKENAWEWAWQFAVPLLNLMAVAYGRNPTVGPKLVVLARLSSLPFQ